MEYFRGSDRLRAQVIEYDSEGDQIDPDIQGTHEIDLKETMDDPTRQISEQAYPLFFKPDNHKGTGTPGELQSQADRIVIERSSHNIKRLLKQIDKGSTRYLEWEGSKDQQKLKQGGWVKQEPSPKSRLSRTSQPGTRVKIFRNSGDTNLQETTSLVKKSMQKQLHDFFIQPTDHHPKELEEIHRQEIIDEVVGQAKRAEQRQMLNPSSVLSIRKLTTGQSSGGAAPTMQSVYAGHASFLDYKKRARPVQTKDLVKQLQDPYADPRVLLTRSSSAANLLPSSITPPPMDHIQQAVAQLDMVRKQLSFIKRERFRANQQFVQTQAEMIKSVGLQGSSGSHEESQLTLKRRNNDVLQEALRVHKSKSSLHQESSIEDSRASKGKSSYSKHNVAKKYKALTYGEIVDHDSQRRMSYKQKKIPLNHTFKQDQLKLLFNLLKQEYKERETSLGKTQSLIQLKPTSQPEIIRPQTGSRQNSRPPLTQREQHHSSHSSKRILPAERSKSKISLLLKTITSHQEVLEERDNREKELLRSIEAQQQRERIQRAMTPYSDYGGRKPYNIDLQRTVADAKIVIPKEAEIIYSPDKMFRDKEPSVNDKVGDFISVSSRHTKQNTRRVKNQIERKEKIAQEMLDIRSAASAQISAIRKDSAKSRFLAAINAKIHHETEFN